MNEPKGSTPEIQIVTNHNYLSMKDKDDKDGNKTDANYKRLCRMQREMWRWENRK